MVRRSTRFRITNQRQEQRVGAAELVLLPAARAPVLYSRRFRGVDLVARRLFAFCDLLFAFEGFAT